MDYQIELYKAIIEIIKTGGGYGLWGLVIYLGLGLVKLVIIVGALYLTIKQGLITFQNFYTLRFMASKDKVALLSEESSKRLETFIKEYQESTSQAMKDFMTDAKSLLEESKVSQKDCEDKEDLEKVARKA